MSRSNRLVLRRVATALVALAVAACASWPGTSPRGGLQRIVETGTLRVGLTGEQPPLNMTSRSGQLFGLEVALARILAESMGVEVEFVRMDFPELLPAVEAGEVDVVMSGVTITPERNRRVAFAGPYYVSGKSILARRERLETLRSAGQIGQSSLRFVALEGSTSAVFVRKLVPDAQLVLTQRIAEAVQKVIDGEADAFVADREITLFAFLRNRDRGLAALTEPLTTEPIGIAMPPHDPLFVNLMQNYLNALEDTGILSEARQYWFEDPSWLKDLR